MKRRNFVLLATVALSLLLASCGTSTPTGNTPPPSAGATVSADMLEYGTNRWFIELEAEPSSELGSLSLISSQQQDFRTLAAQAGIQYQELYAFQTLFNGFSIELNNLMDILSLAQLPGVVAVYPVVEVSLPETTAGSDPDMATALAMTGADIAQNELGLSGLGIRVAIIDSGIDYMHPDLGGGFGPGFRVSAGWDFVGDDFMAGRVPQPGPDPMDCGGHGTHVAGIVGASAAAPGGVTGVAPGVEFGAYRVFGCTGSTTSDIILAALEMALVDRMHVVNMSLGAAFQWPQYPTAMASNRLVSAGVVVVASIGNSGGSGLYTAGAPGVGRDVIGVASYDNTFVSLNVFTISPDGAPIGYATATGSPAPPTSGSLPVTRTGTVTTPNDACAPLPAGSLAGQAALIRRGTCPFHDKAVNAQNAGAAAVLLYNNAPGRFAPTVSGATPIVIPVVAISDTEGVLINSRLDQGPVTLTWTAEEGSFPNATGNLISGFSSYGMTPDLELKPDLGGPGGLIRSTYPRDLGDYATLSGTSMSAPHVAGAVALLLQAHPGTPARAVRTILQNTAEPKIWGDNPQTGLLDAVHRQGAGMINIVNAIQYNTQATPSKLSLGASANGIPVNTITVSNRSAQPVTYNITHFGAVGTSGIRNPGFRNEVSTASFSTTQLVVPARGRATFTVSVTPHPNLPNHSIYGGYIVLSGNNAETVRIPYAGFAGDYQSIRVLAPTANGFPWLARINPNTGGFVRVTNPGHSFSMVGDDVPHFLYHLAHQSRVLEFRVTDNIRVTPERLMAPAWSFTSRNSTATGFFAFAWDGSFYRAVQDRFIDLPNGNYTAEIRVLKALGNPNNPEHWEVWTSPSFLVLRP